MRLVSFAVRLLRISLLLYSLESMWCCDIIQKLLITNHVLSQCRLSSIESLFLHVKHILFKLAILIRGSETEIGFKIAVEFFI